MYVYNSIYICNKLRERILEQQQQLARMKRMKMKTHDSSLKDDEGDGRSQDFTKIAHT